VLSGALRASVRREGACCQHHVGCRRGCEAAMKLSSFDVYPKTLQEFRQRTLSGAIISLASMVLITTLAMVEVIDFAQVKTNEHLFVDTTRGQQLRINMNITFPALPCSVITLDTLDMSGNHAPDKARNVVKTRLDAKGAPIPPSLPTAAGGRQLLSLPSGGGSIKEVGRQAASRQDLLLSALLSDLLPNVFENKEEIAELKSHLGEGCHVEGYLLVNKVAGNFHFAMSRSDHHVLMKVYGQRESINVSHVIHSISFGEEIPSMINPLDKTPKIVHEGSGYFQYHIKVVPTLYEPWYGPPVQTNQYSYTELFRTTHEMDKFPAVYFHYEFSPIMAKFTEERRSYSSFLTGLCAIIGGVVALAGVVDSSVHRIKSLTGGGKP